MGEEKVMIGEEKATISTNEEKKKSNHESDNQKSFAFAGSLRNQNRNMITDESKESKKEEAKKTKQGIVNPRINGIKQPIQSDGTRKRNVRPEVYQVQFDNRTNHELGFIVQQYDEEIPGTNFVRERLAVKMITDIESVRGPITEGSLLLSINGMSVLDKTYNETLTLLKKQTWPLTLEFEQGQTTYTPQGICIKCTLRSINPPRSLDGWKQRYYVLGGPIAGKNVLQLYKSKSDFDTAVEELILRKPLSVKFKTYYLTRDYNCTMVKDKYYITTNKIRYFSIIRPGVGNNKVTFIGCTPSDTSDHIDKLNKEILLITTPQK